MRLVPCTHQVHGLEELDGDLLIKALVGLGIQMQAEEIEPFEVFRDLMFEFRDSSGDAKVNLLARGPSSLLRSAESFFICCV